MKSIAAVLLIASTNAIMLESDILMAGEDIWAGPYTVTSADDEGFEIPK